MDKVSLQKALTSNFMRVMDEVRSLGSLSEKGTSGRKFWSDTSHIMMTSEHFWLNIEAFDTREKEIGAKVKVEIDALPMQKAFEEGRAFDTRDSLTVTCGFPGGVATHLLVAGNDAAGKEYTVVSFLTRVNEDQSYKVFTTAYMAKFFWDASVKKLQRGFFLPSVFPSGLEGLSELPTNDNEVELRKILSEPEMIELKDSMLMSLNILQANFDLEENDPGWFGSSVLMDPTLMLNPREFV